MSQTNTVQNDRPTTSEPKHDFTPDAEFGLDIMLVYKIDDPSKRPCNDPYKAENRKTVVTYSPLHRRGYMSSIENQKELIYTLLALLDIARKTGIIDAVPQRVVYEDHDSVEEVVNELRAYLRYAGVSF